MKLVSFFVAGDATIAVGVVNELRLVLEYSHMMPSKEREAEEQKPFPANFVEGHRVFVKLSDQRYHWLIRELTERGHGT